MYEFYYDYMKEHNGDRCKLLFTDTDSLCCEIETADIYQTRVEIWTCLTRAILIQIIPCIPRESPCPGQNEK